jgi:hypothetical protein
MAQQMQMSPWLTTDETNEAVGALEMAARHLEEAAQDAHMWKWALLALHNAIQGFMVLALRGTWAVGTLSQDVRDRQIAAHHALLKAIEQGDHAAVEAAEEQERRLWAENHLAGFNWLYARIKDEDQWAMRQWGNDKVFDPGPTCDQSMEHLKSLRDDYLHFVPKTRTDSVTRFTTIALDGLSMIAFLMNETNLITWMPWEDNEARADTALARALRAAEHLREVFPIAAPVGNGLN